MQYWFTAAFFLGSLLALIGIPLDIPEYRDDVRGGDPVPLSTLLVAFGAVFVVYRIKFSRWADEHQKPLGFPLRPTRNFTTWLHYQLWASVYACSGVLLVYLIFTTPTEIVGLLKTLQWDVFSTASEAQSPLPPEDGQLTGGSLQALLLGVAVAMAFLGLPGVELQWRAALQKAAWIPSRATSLVDSYRSNFDSFEPEEKEVDLFVGEMNGREGMPYLYAADFHATHVDESYLEIYPMVEFMLWKLDKFRPADRLSKKIDQFKQDIEDIKKEMNEMRGSIRGIGQVIDSVYGNRFPGEIAELHDRAGFGEIGDNPISVTLYDNILREVPKWQGTSREEDRIIIGYVRQNLKTVRQRCDQILKQLLQIIVMMALRQISPEKVLAQVGFGVHIRGRGAIGLDRIPWIILAIVLGSVLVAILFALARTGAKDEIVIAYTIAMMSGAVISAYLIANIVVLEQEFDVRRGFQSAHQSIDVALCFVAAWSMVVLFISIINRQETGLFTGVGAYYYAHVSAVFGTYIAISFFRSAANKDSFAKMDVIALPSVAGLATLFGMMVSSGEVLMPFQPDNLVRTGVMLAATFIIAAVFLAMIWFISRVPSDAKRIEEVAQ